MQCSTLPSHAVSVMLALLSCGSQPGQRCSTVPTIPQSKIARPSRAGRWRSPPAVAPGGGGVPPSPPTVPPSARRHTPTSTEAKRSRARSQSSRRRPLSADPAGDAPPPPRHRRVVPSSLAQCASCNPTVLNPVDRSARGGSRAKARAKRSRARAKRSRASSGVAPSWIWRPLRAEGEGVGLAAWISLPSF